MSPDEARAFPVLTNPLFGLAWLSPHSQTSRGPMMSRSTEIGDTFLAKGDQFLQGYTKANIRGELEKRNGREIALGSETNG